MNKIKELLEKRGMTQRELADRVGVTEVSMSRYISGDRVPKGPIAAKIARELDADITDVIDIDFGDKQITAMPVETARKYSTDESILKTYKIGRENLASMAFANCRMILENAMAMPDSYIVKYYGSDSNMCDVAEKYFDLGVKILREMPHMAYDVVNQVAPLRQDGSDDEDGGD